MPSIMWLFRIGLVTRPWSQNWCYWSHHITMVYIQTQISLSYLLLGISQPGSSDILQYSWILQYGTAMASFITGMSHTVWTELSIFNSSLANMIQGLQYLTLFPRRVGLLIGICNGLGHLCSSWPQLWLKLIRNSHLTYPQIMFIWAGLAFASFFIGLFVYPWHNVPNNYAEIEEKGIDTINRDKFIYTCFKNKPPKSMTFEWGAAPRVLIIWFR